MRFHQHVCRTGIVGALALVLCIAGQPARAQIGTGDGTGTGAGTGTGTGDNTNNNQNAAGIAIDAHGVVTPAFATSTSQALDRKRALALAQKKLPHDVNQFSALRKVSLVRLEAACEKQLRESDRLPLEMDFLAGLQRIDYVFVFPEERELLIAGPAEGFASDQAGQVRGVTTGRPPLRLDDLIVALRALEQSGQIGCSIDPKPERLKEMQSFLDRNSGVTSVRIAKARIAHMAKLLGMQGVRTWGVPEDSHFAQVLVAADYRMKRISMGLEDPRVPGLRSHLSMLAPTGNSLQRWWFVPYYDAFQITPDRNAFMFSGQRAQLVSQEEEADASGERHDAANTRLSTQRFAQLFTEKFPQLCDRAPIFAELQNLIDVAVLAALFKKEQLPQSVGWTMSFFLDDRRAVLAKGNAPREVATSFNLRLFNGRMLLGLVGGGVTIDARRTVEYGRFATSGGDELTRAAQQADGKRPESADSWWWD